ncbi:hypothetical protein TrST_g7764 [Triparma strigata]|uniref:ubiquitinyl hydrolase 1 n=1 Tax=Triparma strigata TaxID=1606541 RepID=A0A9W7EYY0_9STRA|nr:hypothetical protein TrST_g7764 [Triparma strigata]
MTRSGTTAKKTSAKAVARPAHELCLNALQALESNPSLLPHLLSPEVSTITCMPCTPDRGGCRIQTTRKKSQKCRCDSLPYCLSSLGVHSSGIWDPKSPVNSTTLPTASPEKALRKITSVSKNKIIEYFKSLNLNVEVHDGLVENVKNVQTSRVLDPAMLVPALPAKATAKSKTNPPPTAPSSSQSSSSSSQESTPKLFNETIIMSAESYPCIEVLDAPAPGWTRHMIDKKRENWADCLEAGKKKSRVVNIVVYTYKKSRSRLFRGNKPQQLNELAKFLDEEGFNQLGASDFEFDYDTCLTIEKSKFDNLIRNKQATPSVLPLALDPVPAPGPAPDATPAPTPTPSTTNLLALATPPGLVNLGATCYLNSLVQCLFQNVAFRRGLYAYDPWNLSGSSDSKLFGILDQLQMLFTNLDRSVRKRLDLKELTDRLGLNTAEQQDPQEFVTLFMGKVEEPFKRLAASSPGSTKSFISNIFDGRFTQVVTCETCGNRSTRPFEDEIRLAMHSNTDVRTCVDDYFEAEILAGDNAYFCGECNSKQTAKKATEVNEPPNVLNLQLLRYVYDMTTWTKKKIKSKIKLNKTIEIPVKNENEEPRMETYVLASVLNHIGNSAYQGHYICEAMDWSTGVWWKYNDELVNFIGNGPKHVAEETEAEVMAGSAETGGSPMEIDLTVDVDDAKNKRAKKNGKGRKKTTAAAGSEDAYMLVYVKKSFLEKESQCTTLDPPKKTLDEVEKDNSNLKGDIEKTKGGIKSNLELINLRKEAIARIFGFKADVKPESRIPTLSPSNSDDNRYNLIDTKWLREWITGEEVPWDDVVVVDVDKPDNKAEGGSSQANAIEIESSEDDGEGEKEKASTPAKEEPSTDSTSESQNALRGAVKIRHAQFACSKHSNSPHLVFGPLDIHRFKVLPARAYREIIKEVAREMKIMEEEVCDFNISFRTTETGCSAICGDCNAEAMSLVSDNKQLFEEWKQISCALDSVESKKKGQEEEGYFVSSAWIGSFQKAFKDKTNTVVKNGLASLETAKGVNLFELPKKPLENGVEVYDVETADESEMMATTPTKSSALASIFQQKTTASPLSFDVNSKIVCVHKKFIKAHNRNKYKVVPKRVWDLIKTSFPDAIECSSAEQGCEMCENRKKGENEKERNVKAWSSDCRRNLHLKELLRDERKKVGFHTSMLRLLDPSADSYPQALPPSSKKRKVEREDGEEVVERTIKNVHLVDRKGLQAWRTQVNEIARAGSIDDKHSGIQEVFRESESDNALRCDCQEAKALIPERLNNVLLGVAPDQGYYDPYRIGVESEAGDDAKMKQCELVTGEELEALNLSLREHDILRGLYERGDEDNDKPVSKVTSYNTATLKQEESGVRNWTWEVERCSECMKSLSDEELAKRMQFERKKIRVISVPNNHSVPGVARKVVEEVEDDKDNNDNNDEFTPGGDDDGRYDGRNASKNANEGGILGSVLSGEEVPQAKRQAGGEKEEAADFGSPASTGTRRSKRQASAGKSEEVEVNSSDKLGNLRLKLWEQFGTSPVGQHMYFNGKELVFGDNEKTLFELQVTAGSTIYVQMDKRGMTKGEREQFHEDEEGLIATLFSSCGSDENSGSNRVERGFGGSWLMGGSGVGGGDEVEEIGVEEEEEEKEEEMEVEVV